MAQARIEKVERNVVAPDNEIDSPFQDVPRLDSYYIMHETPRVQYLVQKVKFMDRKKFSFRDHQFALSARVKPVEGGNQPLLLISCRNGIQQAIHKILIHLRDYYNEKNAEAQERERCFLTICQRNLQTGIICGNFNLRTP